MRACLAFNAAEAAAKAAAVAVADALVVAPLVAALRVFAALVVLPDDVLYS